MSLKSLASTLALLAPLSASAALTLHYGVIGDAGDWNPMTEAAMHSMKKHNVHRLVLPGDNLYDTKMGYAAQWDPWSKAGFSFDVVAIGNHHTTYEEETHFFKMPAEYFAKSVDGRVRFIVLNSDNLKTPASQAKWLDAQLTNATERLVFLVYHHPTYNVSTTGHTWDERKEFQTLIRPLLVKHRSRITAVLVGHDHITSLVHFGDLPAVVSGSVQSVYKIDPWDGPQGDVDVQTGFYFDFNNTWVRLTLPAADPSLATFSYIRTQDNKTTCTVKVHTGQKAVLGKDCAAAYRKKS